MGQAFTLNFENREKKIFKKSKEQVDQTLFRIVIDNIIYGVDKRTTVMIRHIPNKYATNSLMEELNTICKGKYDFFYLPMDYEVVIYLYRINVILDMLLLTLLNRCICCSFMMYLRQGSGRSINRIKSVI
jgi:hypothetical protein